MKHFIFLLLAVAVFICNACSRTYYSEQRLFEAKKPKEIFIVEVDDASLDMKKQMEQPLAKYLSNTGIAIHPYQILLNQAGRQLVSPPFSFNDKGQMARLSTALKGQGHLLFLSVGQQSPIGSISIVPPSQDRENMGLARIDLYDLALDTLSYSLRVSCLANKFGLPLRKKKEGETPSSLEFSQSGQMLEAKAVKKGLRRLAKYLRKQ
jgi:hypothetical protein